MTLGSHVLPWWQTDKHIPRLGSVRRAPLQQFKRCMKIALLLIGLIPTRCVIPVSVMTAPGLQEGALVDNGDAVPESCLPPLEMRSPTGAGGLLPAGGTSTFSTILKQGTAVSDVQEVKMQNLVRSRPMHLLSSPCSVDIA